MQKIKLFSFVFALVLFLGLAHNTYAKDDKNYDDRRNNSDSSFCDWGGRWGNWLKDSDFCKDKKKNKPPVVYIYATKYVIREGGSTELYLKTKNEIESCTASGGWSGTKSSDVRESVSPATTTTYTITCSNAYGSYTDHVEIMVKKPRKNNPPATTTAPTLDFSGSPLSILNGATSTLTWNSSNASFCLASNGWSGSKSFSGNQIVSPNATTTYTLACGNVVGTTTKNVTIGVMATSSPTPAPTVDLGASSSTIYNGASSTLSWSSTNATSCTASNGWSGSKSVGGSEIVLPSATTTYTLTCSGAGGSANDSVTVGVWATSTPNPPQNLDHIIISEVYYDVDSAHGNDDNEWVELYNGTGATVDISGWWLHDAGASGGDAIPSGTTIPNNSFLLITGTTTTAGFWSGKTFVVLPSTTIGAGLANSGDGVVLKNAASTTVDAMSYGTNTTFLNPAAPAVADGHSLKRSSVIVDTNTASDWEDEDSPTPGAQ